MGQDSIPNSLQVSTSKAINTKLMAIDSLIKVDGPTREIARLNIDLAWIYLNREGNAKDAQYYNTIGDSLAQILRDTSLLAETHTILGRIYTRIGYFASSLAFQQKALDYKAALQDTGRMIYSLNLMARAYMSQKKYDQALSFYQRGLTFSKALGLQISFNTNRALSFCYMELGDLKKARYHAEIAQAMVKDGTRRAGRSYLTLARVEVAEGKLQQALGTALKAEDHILKYGAILGRAEVGVLIAEILYRLGRYNKAKEVAGKALEIAKMEDHKVYVLDALKILKGVAENQNDFKAAFQYTTSIQEVSDSFYRQEEMIKSLDFETLYRLKEKEQEIEQLERREQENRQELALRDKQKSILLITLFSSFLLLSTIIWFILYRRNVEQKINQKDKIIHKQKISDLQQKQESIRLKSMIEGQEKERLRLSREIHDGLGGLLSTAKTYLSEKNGSDSNIRKLIDQSCEEVREITNNLAPVALNVLGLEAAIYDLGNKAEIIGLKCNVELHQLHINDPGTSLAVFRIVQELVNNVIKHAKAETLMIQLIQSERDLQILVEDDGIGFIKVEKPNNNMGLRNIESRLSVLGGSMDIESNPGIGTSVNVFIPLNTEYEKN